MTTFKRNETAQLISNYGKLFQYLGRLYRKEIDEDQLKHLCSLEFAQDMGEPNMEKGSLILHNFFKNVKEDTISTLSVDFARVFLGAGPKPEFAAVPHESVFTNPKGLMMQEAKDEMTMLLNDEQLQLEFGNPEPEDHISSEFDYLHHLCEKASNGFRIGDNQMISTYLSKIKTFFNHHLLNWVPCFCDRVIVGAATDFYKGLGLLTKGFLTASYHLILEIERDLFLETDMVLAVGESEVA